MFGVDYRRDSYLARVFGVFNEEVIRAWSERDGCPFRALGLHRFAGCFTKYALGKFGKRIEHQQHFDLETVLALFEARGFEVQSLARVPAGFSWMNDPRTKRRQGPFTDALAAPHRSTGLDLGRDANFALPFRKVGGRGARPTPHERRVTRVCRECGEHAVLSPPTPREWTCLWCGKPNPLGGLR
jgi:hypothetical protein